jgi:hypothetical protein
MTERRRTSSNTPGGGAIRNFAVLSSVATLTAGIVAGLGCLAAPRLTDQSVLREVLLGTGVSWLASCIGAVPLALAIAGRSRQMANAILGSTALRFFVVLLLVVPLTLSGWVDRTALALSVAVSYLCLLAVDTYFAARAAKSLDRAESI